MRIFKEIHNNLYLKSDRHLSPTILPQVRKHPQSGGGGGGGRGKSDVPFYVSPLMFNNSGSPSSTDSVSTYQHLPMGPLRPGSITSHCDVHTFAALHPGEIYAEFSLRQL